MSALSLRDFKKVQKVIKEAQAIVKVTGPLETLFSEHNIGRRGNAGWFLSATDRSRLRVIVADLNGLDPLYAKPHGTRMEVARQGATDEKLARERPLENRVVCTALPGPITYSDVSLPAVHGVEYRLDFQKLATSAFDAVLCIENHEAFLAAHQLNWHPPGNTLVLYRGHDVSAKAVKKLMYQFACTGKPVIFSSDVDPAGIQMTLSSSATHALVPCESWREGILGSGLWQRAADQLLRLPSLPQSVREDDGLSPAFREYASWVLFGRAFTEEGLLSQTVLMQHVPIRQ